MLGRPSRRKYDAGILPPAYMRSSASTVSGKKSKPLTGRFADCGCGEQGGLVIDGDGTSQQPALRGRPVSAHVALTVNTVVDFDFSKLIWDLPRFLLSSWRAVRRTSRPSMETTALLSRLFVYPTLCRHGCGVVLFRNSLPRTAACVPVRPSVLSFRWGGIFYRFLAVNLALGI